MKIVIMNFILVGLLSVQAVYSQHNISGYVFDEKTGESLIGANIRLTNAYHGTISNEFGYYSLDAGAGKVEIICSFTGYSKQHLCLELKGDTSISFYLVSGFQLSEYEVKAEKSYLSSSETGLVTMSSKQMNMLPSLTGEVDVLKALQMMPGISGGQEIGATLLVRGGNPDENLILLDDVPIYYTGHLGGFTSIFDESAIKSIKTYKGGFPARYGERLSSVVDIRTRDGNMKEHEGEVQIGTLVSKIAVNGPLVKDKTSYFFSLRRSNIDWILKPSTYASFDRLGYVTYLFYDLNAKMNHRFSENDRLYFSFYKGNDKFNIHQNDKDPEDEKPRYNYISNDGLNWGNNIASLRWNHLFKSDLFMNVTLARLNYYFNESSESVQRDDPSHEKARWSTLQYHSNVIDYLAKMDFSWSINNYNRFKSGAAFTYHNYHPVATEYQFELDTSVFINEMYESVGYPENEHYVDDGVIIAAKEYSLFGEYLFSFNHLLDINIGLRYSGFSTPGMVYQSLQPRLSANVRLNEKNSIKASYANMEQYTHLLASDNGGGLPSDVWVPSTDKVAPGVSHQYTLGWFWAKNTNGWTGYLDCFYKSLSKLIDFKRGANIFSKGSDWEDKIELDGTGAVKGLELKVEKTGKKWNGWLGYTLSKNERCFEGLNDGKPYPAKFERMHDLEIATNYKLNNRVDVSASWMYSSGIYQTLGMAKGLGMILSPDYNSERYVIGKPTDYQFAEIYIYAKKNNFQYPAYHRLDLSVRFKKQKKHGLRTITIGVINAYNHLNPYTVYYDKDVFGKTHLKQKSLFPLLPSISYKYAFKISSKKNRE